MYYYNGKAVISIRREAYGEMVGGAMILNEKLLVSD